MPLLNVKLIMQIAKEVINSIYFNIMQIMNMYSFLYYDGCNNKY